MTSPECPWLSRSPDLESLGLCSSGPVAPSVDTERQDSNIDPHPRTDAFARSNGVRSAVIWSCIGSLTSLRFRNHLEIEQV